MKKWLLLSRPKTLLTGLAPVLLAYSHLSKNSINIDNSLFVLTLICVVLLQIGSNIANDLYDGIRGIDTKDRIGPKRSMSSGDISYKKLKQVTYSIFTTAFFIGSYISYKSGIEIFFIGLLSIVVAYAYTGGPFPLAYYALGEFLAFIFFGVVAVVGVYFIQSQTINLDLWYSACMPGFFSAALMSLNNYRDIYSDKKTKKKTLAIFIGEKKSKYLTILLIMIGTINGMILHELSLELIVLPLILSITSITFLLKTPHGENLNKGLGLISFTNLSWCFFIFLSSRI
jgi:1,4-dihydroxy-2-naphthoate polyprenyltransferase